MLPLCVFFQDRWFQSVRFEDEIAGEVHHLNEPGHDEYKDTVGSRRPDGKNSRYCPRQCCCFTCSSASSVALPSTQRYRRLRGSPKLTTTLGSHLISLISRN